MIQQWRQKEVVKEMGDLVEERLEAVGEIVKTDARRNLLRIGAPEFGVKYRRLLALYRLRWVVSRSRNEVKVSIGLPKGRKGSDYGFWIEMGSKSAPAHPWLRPALFNNLSNILKIIERG